MRRLLQPTLMSCLFVFAYGACGDDERGPDEPCRTNADCATEGSGGNLSCLNGQCVEVCEVDVDCQDDDPNRICENLVCVAGCKGGEVTCSSGMCLDNGRCAIFYDGFEPGPGETVVTLDTLRARPQQAWDDIPREKRNNASDVVFRGVPGCGIETEDEKCAGPASEGQFFLVLERVKTPPRGLIDTSGFTCAACKCCRDCRDFEAQLHPYREGESCLGFFIPDPDDGGMPPPMPECSATIPAQCQTACDACSGCMDAATQVGMGLNECETMAAQKTCTACAPGGAYDQCLQAAQTNLEACLNGASTPEETQACNEAGQMATALCADSEDGKNCLACDTYFTLREDMSIDPLEYADATMRCMNQGNDGCFPTTIDVVRSALTEDEQAIVSPPIALPTDPSLNLVLQFDYIPFNIAATYTRIIQGADRSTWPEEPQEVLVEVCGGSCDMEASWMAATFVDGGAAQVPSDIERNNGLRLRQQNAADWSINRRRVSIPAAVRTGEFRFRLVPKLADDAQVGFDNFVIRSVQ